MPQKPKKQAKEQKKSEPSKMGRPSVFNDVVGEKIVELFSEGRTRQEVADIIGIHETTLGIWLRKNDKLRWASNEARKAADDLVVASLWRRAIGYSHEAVKHFYDKDKGEVIEHRYIEQYPPDTNAAKYWLGNRQPDQWREKTEVTHKVEEMTDAELKALVEEFLADQRKAEG